MTKIPSRHAILRSDLPDNFTRCLYRIAPYKGCAHGCRYCDGRAEKYYVEGNFERDIEIRSSIPELLATELPKLRERGIIAFGSGVTDPYQPCENDVNISNQCAAMLASHRHPALVMTKSSLVLRDLYLWNNVNINSGFILLISLTSTDENVRRTMEPGASPFFERIETLKKFKEAGCVTGVLAMPFLPGISDSSESIWDLYAVCAKIGVDFIMPGGLTLRPGRQKDLYLETLRSFKPALLETTLNLYSEERPSGFPIARYNQELAKRIKPIRREFGIPWLLPHRRLSRMLPAHDMFRILLQDMIELYSDRSIDTGPLKDCARKYDEWLIGIRRLFRRKRSLPPSWLEERITESLNTGELDSVLGNKRLAHFAHSVIEDGAILDYRSLKLENHA
jgi:DNA repair photolyase